MKVALQDLDRILGEVIPWEGPDSKVDVVALYAGPKGAAGAIEALRRVAPQPSRVRDFKFDGGAGGQLLLDLTMPGRAKPEVLLLDCSTAAAAPLEKFLGDLHDWRFELEANTAVLVLALPANAQGVFSRRAPALSRAVIAELELPADRVKLAANQASVPSPRM